MLLFIRIINNAIFKNKWRVYSIHDSLKYGLFKSAILNIIKQKCHSICYIATFYCIRNCRTIILVHIDHIGTHINIDTYNINMVFLYNYIKLNFCFKFTAAVNKFDIIFIVSRKNKCCVTIVIVIFSLKKIFIFINK